MVERREEVMHMISSKREVWHPQPRQALFQSRSEYE